VTRTGIIPIQVIQTAILISHDKPLQLASHNILFSFLLEKHQTSTMPSPLKNKQHTVNFADPESQHAAKQPPAEDDDEDDASLSSKSSSSVSISKDFVEDSTSETKSTSKRSQVTATTSTTNWLDGEMDATKSSTLVIIVVVVTAVVLGSVTFAVMKKQDENAFQSKVRSLANWRCFVLYCSFLSKRFLVYLLGPLYYRRTILAQRSFKWFANDRKAFLALSIESVWESHLGAKTGLSTQPRTWMSLLKSF
jgi:hypothetical protein